MRENKKGTPETNTYKHPQLLKNKDFCNVCNMMVITIAAVTTLETGANPYLAARFINYYGEFTISVTGYRRAFRGKSG